MPTAEIAAFFRRVAASNVQPRLRGVKGTAQVIVKDAGTWRVTVNDGTVTVTNDGHGDHAPADCRIACTAEDFLRILHQERHMNILAAIMQERVTLSGDQPFAWAVLGNLEFEPVDAASR